MEKNNNNIRTRYAPSPTGYFHIGGAWTALQNYLFAKHYNGSFIVRMEDTDDTRNIKGGIQSQLDGLNWLGIIPDESPNKPGKFGPYIQSKKFADFAKRAMQLVSENKAYYCFCTQEELKKKRDDALKNHQTPKYDRSCLNLSKEEIAMKLKKKVPYVIRLKMPDVAEISWDDLIRGKISFPLSALTDPVILKSNGIPMYNFAVVCDDHDMKISHIFRAEEHISNTPYQIAIRNALGYNDDIKIGHLPIIVDATGKKLSKRDKTLKAFIELYKKDGYYPQALLNFLALLGWTAKNNQEIFTLNELINQYDGTRISTAPAFFDIKKLDWVSKTYFKNMTSSEYLIFVKQFINTSAYAKKYSKTQIDELLLLFKTYITNASDLKNELEPFIKYSISKTPVVIKEYIKTDNFIKNISSLLKSLKKVKSITLENAKPIIEEVKQDSGLNGKDLYFPLRIVTINKEHGPEMDKTMYIIGKEQIINNINAIIKKYKLKI